MNIDMSQVTPHLGVAGGVTLIALLVCVGPLLSWPVSLPVEERIQKVPAIRVHVLTFEEKRALTPVVETYARTADWNPFVGKKAGEGKPMSIPRPPAPPLAPPLPPVLPLVEK